MAGNSWQPSHECLGKKGGQAPITVIKVKSGKKKGGKWGREGAALRRSSHAKPTLAVNAKHGSVQEHMGSCTCTCKNTADYKGTLALFVVNSIKLHLSNYISLLAVVK